LWLHCVPISSSFTRTPRAVYNSYKSTAGEHLTHRIMVLALHYAPRCRINANFRAVRQKRRFQGPVPEGMEAALIRSSQAIWWLLGQLPQLRFTIYMPQLSDPKLHPFSLPSSLLNKGLSLLLAGPAVIVSLHPI
jgi:hypothetical protein